MLWLVQDYFISPYYNHLLDNEDSTHTLIGWEAYLLESM